MIRKHNHIGRIGLLLCHHCNLLPATEKVMLDDGICKNIILLCPECAKLPDAEIAYPDGPCGS